VEEAPAVAGPGLMPMQSFERKNSVAVVGEDCLAKKPKRENED